MSARHPNPRRRPAQVVVVIPDSHGEHIDKAAAKAIIRDIRRLDPTHVVRLGDHVDCAGLFSAHQRQYTNELAESYEDDCAAANDFLDATQKAAPRAEDHYLEGNHEAHAERYAAQAYASKRDADGFLERNAPAAMLRLKQRSIRYYRRQTCYQGIAIPGTIRIGRCYYTHGICHGTNATRQHLVRFCDNVVHGHTHRAAAVVERSVTKHAYGAWCPGTLSKLQPLYMHTSPSNWTHGYAVQFVAPSGRFLHVQVPIVNGESLLDLIPNLG